MSKARIVVIGCLMLIVVASYFWVSHQPPSKHNPESSDTDASDFIAIAMESGNLWVARKEVTIGQWLRCEEEGGCKSVSADSSKRDHPITGVNWRDTEDFLNWYNKNYAIPVRLPTRNEWLQFAADDAPKPKVKLFDDPRLAWAADYDLTAVPQSRSTELAGSFGVNALNIYDLKGNVWEWVDTCQVEIDPVLKKTHSCITGRYAMGQHAAVLSDLVRNPGNAGCGGGLPPANVGFRLVWSES